MERLRQSDERGCLWKTKESRCGNIAKTKQDLGFWGQVSHMEYVQPCDAHLPVGSTGEAYRKVRISLRCRVSGFLTVSQLLFARTNKLGMLIPVLSFSPGLKK